MRRVEPIRREVNASQGDAEGVQPGDLIHVDGGDVGADIIDGVAGLVEARSVEVVGCDVVHVLAYGTIDEHCKKVRSVYVNI